MRLLSMDQVGIYLLWSIYFINYFITTFLGWLNSTIPLYTAFIQGYLAKIFPWAVWPLTGFDTTVKFEKDIMYRFLVYSTYIGTPTDYQSSQSLRFDKI